MIKEKQQYLSLFSVTEEVLRRRVRGCSGPPLFRGQRIEHFALLACRHQNCAEHQHQA